MNWHAGRIGNPDAEGATASETLRPTDQHCTKLWRVSHSGRRRDSDLRHKDRGGIKARALPRVKLVPLDFSKSRGC